MHDRDEVFGAQPLGELELMVVDGVAVACETWDDDRALPVGQRGEDRPDTRVRHDDSRRAHVLDELVEGKKVDAFGAHGAHRRLPVLHHEPLLQTDAVEGLQQPVERLAGPGRDEDHGATTGSDSTTAPT